MSTDKYHVDSYALFIILSLGESSDGVVIPPNGKHLLPSKIGLIIMSNTSIFT
jgi:hypothetical protein